ncbi:cation-translocating P-type ATPase [Roseiflexus castenholzii]|uniref:ATPase, P-type (Transporting), HAD superfamily, subfamily IC n=1 Tax=Roseiflexus castenholzii (strain DSM 13941 / HLO8) TaxID=383372 RepID=A7NJI6_ROSCS|nr:HAD-IC family P-type ATPase [Roseiflexus castenholzii]ABU57656.1 ATPase, P-type (transporting), HAD superfamily, subfamily IC [Roseiflexus castenholzii DSM 13941]
MMPTDLAVQPSSPPAILGVADLLPVLERAFAQGGTFRDMLVALSEHRPCLISGAALREALDACHVRQALDEFLPYPQVVESLDEVYVTQSGNQSVIELHFAQPHAIPQSTPIGTVTVQIDRTLTLSIDERGDVTLKPGDMRLRWLGMTEPLLVRLRRIDGPQGAQDVVQVSAGNVLSQTTPLSVLTVPTAPAPAIAIAPPPPPAPAAPPVTITVVVVHRLPGRVRLRPDGLYRNPAQKERIERRLARQPGIRAVAANIRTGTVLVHFDATMSIEEVQARLVQALTGAEEADPRQPQHPWHTMPVAEVAQILGASLNNGLDPIAARQRLHELGANALPDIHRRSTFSMLIEQFSSLPVALLGVSAILSIATGGVADGVVILSVVLINAGIGFFTEHWAEQTIAGLSHSARPVARVVRGGIEHDLPGEELVPGDVVVLKRGMPVPADARLIEADDLTVDESALTGESIPVAKRADVTLGRETPLGSRANMVYRGATVTGGGGRALVVATGATTEVGQIQRMLTETEQPETPLQRQLRTLGSQLALLSLAICGGVFVIGLLRGHGFLMMLKTSVSLAVAAIPEGLPTVATTTLALGLRRLERQNILVRRLVAVETLGAAQDVCLDKTGTITLNQMTLVTVFAGRHLYRHEEATFRRDEDGTNGARTGELAYLLQLTALCSEVRIEMTNGSLRLQGTPTEIALVQAAFDAGIDVAALRRRHPLLRAQPRSEQRGYMVTWHADDDHELLAIKGAPDQVLAMCNRHLCDGVVQPLLERDRVRIVTENERMAGQALRVLGVAYAYGSDPPEERRDLIWVGLAGIADPPRPGMRELMARFRAAGLHPIIVTGDQSATAHAIARQIGLRHDGRLEGLDAAQLEHIPPDVLRSLAQRIDIFSRVSPAHKLRIVQALQRAGRVVAMTGDGINDGPALRAADIGIAMGRDGSQLAQEVADIVIRDDNLQTIIVAIEQGRTIYDDIKKAVHFILASNASEIAVTLIATAIGIGEPFNPIQLLWINLVTDIFPELALGVELPEADVMARPPRDPHAPMFSRADLQNIGIEGMVLTASTLVVYGIGLSRYGIGPRASTMAFSTITTAQLLHALSCRSERHSIFARGACPPNPYMPLAVGSGLGLQAMATLLPGLRGILGTMPLGPLDWVIVAGAAIVPLIVNEIKKEIVHARFREETHEER